MNDFLNVKEVTDILIEHSLAKDIDSTRRFIRLNELPATKECNFSGYRISKKALDAFIWVKKSTTSEIVNQVMDLKEKYELQNNSSSKKYKVASFFAGIGGFDLGCESAGMEVVFQCEINKFS